MPSSLPVRVLLAVAALAAITWLALGLRAASALQNAEEIKSRQPSELNVDAVTDARRELQRARDNSPDSDALLIEAELLLRAGREVEAAAAIDPLVRAEPENLEAWALLAVAVKERDPRRFDEAERAVLGLSPISR